MGQLAFEAIYSETEQIAAVRKFLNVLKSEEKKK